MLIFLWQFIWLRQDLLIIVLWPLLTFSAWCRKRRATFRAKPHEKSKENCWRSPFMSLYMGRNINWWACWRNFKGETAKSKTEKENRRHPLRQWESIYEKQERNVQRTPFFMFCFSVSQKNEITRLSDSLQIFRRALLWSHLFPTVWMRSVAQKQWVFLSTRLSLPRFFWSVRVENWEKKSIHKGREDSVEDCRWTCFSTLQQPFEIKSSKENELFWKNGVKTCPADEFSSSCEKAHNSVAYKLCVGTTVNSFCGAKFCLFITVGYWKNNQQRQGSISHPVSWILSVNASRTSASNQTERDTRLYTQPNDTLLYPIGTAQHVKRSTENCGLVTS